jgi:phenylpropionate dioxygenase-like ring-hydroxylating dioxygenase large terminal subunit
MEPAGVVDDGITLPGSWYTDDAVFEEEKRRIFREAWQYAGPAAAVAEPGDFVTSRAGDVPLVVARATDGALNAFVNVCRHRAAEVVRDERGRRRTLQCHYHAWTYGLDGALRAAPGTNDDPDFDPSQFSLVRAQAETWGPFLFVNPDRSAPSLAETLGDLPGIVASSGLELDGLRLRETADYDTAANWKVVVDNQLECYHCPVAHPSFMTLVDVDDYTLEAHETFSVQRGRVRDSAKDGTAGPYRVREGVDESFYVFVWPNFALNVYPGPGNVSVNVYEPVGPHRTLARYHYYFSDAVSDDELREFVAFIDQVQREDIVLCESVQRGLRSGFYEQGRLIREREDGLRHFQRLVRRALAA